MNANINNSVVATDNSTINNVAIKKTQVKNARNNTTTSGIKNSIIAENGSQITRAVIDIKHVKKKSFWKGFISGVITSVVASGIWYFIQRLIEM